MRIETFSILTGSAACNARCPFCISKMTPPEGVELKVPPVNWRNFMKACRLAELKGVTTAMFTGKGEPLLFPGQITGFLEAMAHFNFPMIEIQTNGIKISENPEEYSHHLQNWHDFGLTTVAISIVHYEPEKNREIYLPYKKQYIDLPALIRAIRKVGRDGEMKGLSVRLTCIGADGYVDSVEKLQKLIEFARANLVEQLTFTPVNKPDEEHSHDKAAWDWINKHHLKDHQLREIMDFVKKNGSHLLTLQHGAKVYDVNGQNLCLNACLTVHPDKDDLRNLIFYPDGSIRYYWQYPGALLF